MLIQITRPGIFRSGSEMVPVGEQIEVPDDFKGWPGKWVKVSDTKGKTLEVATPDSEPETVDDDREQAISAYRDAFSEDPHGRMKTETIWRKVEEAGDE